MLGFGLLLTRIYLFISVIVEHLESAIPKATQYVIYQTFLFKLQLMKKSLGAKKTEKLFFFFFQIAIGCFRV